MSVKPELPQIPEMRELQTWLGNPPRHPRQTHGLNESDSEVIALESGGFLASTTDSISEEILVGLYRDPHTMGWMAAMSSLSDLAAVGAAPTGMLLSAQWAPDTSAAFKARVADGFSDALRALGTYWLGGDSGLAQSTVLTGVALGQCDSKPLSRLGMKPGDVICHTGKFGNGGVLGFRFLRGEADSAFPEAEFRPRARLDAGLALRGIATAAMDTSDGVLSTLDTLRILNGAGLELTFSTETLSGPARAYCEERKIPLWMLWVAEHGDFQLIVSIPPEKLEKAKTLVPDLVVLGRAVKGPGSTVRTPRGKILPVDPSFARTLLSTEGSNLVGAFERLIAHCRDQEFP